MILLCWYLCFYQSLLCLGDWPGESMKISEQGVIDRDDAKNCSRLYHSQSWDLSDRGFSSHGKRRDKEERWGETPVPCLSLCLLALLVSFHRGCFTQGPSCGGFLTWMHLAWVKAVPCQKSLGLSLGKLELLAARLAFPAFGMVAPGSRWQGLSLFVHVKWGARDTEPQSSGPGRCTLPPAIS